jgi:uncharacterized protein with ATP-grasp and redox domains
MQTCLDCIPCFIRQALDAARLVTPDEHLHEQVVREVLRLTARMNLSQSPPTMGQQIHRLIRELTGQDDPYLPLKKRFNNLAMKLYPELEQRVLSAANPFTTAVRLAIAGNIIDFGVNTSLSESEVKKTIKQSLIADLDDNPIQAFQQAVRDATNILYLADNAGEIVFDRLLIEQLPAEKVTVVIKGAPVINDATREDAEFAGLTELVKVIDNGSDAPGTILETCSPDFQDHFDRADLVIAKGQGNYETLSHIDKNIVFILKAKCPVIARDLGCEVGEMILRMSQSSSDKDDIKKSA